MLLPSTQISRQCRREVGPHRAQFPLRTGGRPRASIVCASDAVRLVLDALDRDHELRTALVETLANSHATRQKTVDINVDFNPKVAR
jgi:hypothetical protein